MHFHDSLNHITLPFTSTVHSDDPTPIKNKVQRISAIPWFS